MKILVLNWGVAKEYSWHHTLFEEMVEYGDQFVIVSARKAWEPRGGKIYPMHESFDGIDYLRWFKDINDFKLKIYDSIPNLVAALDLQGSMGEDGFDAVWTFHQANFLAGRRLARHLNCKHIITCEQAFRTSGLSVGAITDRWREIQADTDLIISWAEIDKRNEEVLGVKYLPFGGCYKDIEKYWKPWDLKKRNAIGIYQGSISPDFKNQGAMFDDISSFLKKGICKKFVVNGYPIGGESQQIINRLKEKWGSQFEYSMLVGREKVFDSLSDAFFGYSPMKPSILSNFPYEAFGVGVPMYMPYIENAASYIVKTIEGLGDILEEKEKYNQTRIGAKKYYDVTHSAERMGYMYHIEIERLFS